MHDPLTKTKTNTPETVQDITNQVMRSSARRRYKAITLAAVAAFAAICQRVRAAAAWVAVLELLDLEDDEGTDGDGPHTRLTRTVVPRQDYKQSPWANMLRYQDLLDPTSRAAKRFRRRFRVPRVFFLTLVRRVIEEGWFPAAEVDVVGRMFCCGRHNRGLLYKLVACCSCCSLFLYRAFTLSQQPRAFDRAIL